MFANDTNTNDINTNDERTNKFIESVLDHLDTITGISLDVALPTEDEPKPYWFHNVNGFRYVEVHECNGYDENKASELAKILHDKSQYDLCRMEYEDAHHGDDDYESYEIMIDNYIHNEQYDNDVVHEIATDDMDFRQIIERDCKLPGVNYTYYEILKLLSDYLWTLNHNVDVSSEYIVDICNELRDYIENTNDITIESVAKKMFDANTEIIAYASAYTELMDVLFELGHEYTMSYIGNNDEILDNMEYIVAERDHKCDRMCSLADDIEDIIHYFDILVMGHYEESKPYSYHKEIAWRYNVYW